LNAPRYGDAGFSETAVKTGKNLAGGNGGVTAAER